MTNTREASPNCNLPYYKLFEELLYKYFDLHREYCEEYGPLKGHILVQSIKINSLNNRFFCFINGMMDMDVQHELGELREEIEKMKIMMEEEEIAETDDVEEEDGDFENGE
jgi:hypothetical protein